MPEKVFPSSFKLLWREPTTKAAFIGDEPTDQNAKCHNCGGRGFMTTFIATAGPFEHPPARPKVGHWHDGKWWVGSTEIANCPVCGGQS
jgi:hypothetical protein